MSTGPGNIGPSPANWPWFRKPENWIGIAVPALVGITIFFFWGIISPFVAMALHNLFLSIAFGALSLGMLYVLLSKELRVFVLNAYKMAMWRATVKLVTSDPLAYLRSKFEELKERLRTVNAGYGRVHGRREGLEGKIAEDKDKLVNLYREAKVAQQRNLTEEYAVLADQIKLLEGNIKDYENWLAVLQRLEQILDKIRQVCSYSMRTTKNRIDLAGERQNIANESHRDMLLAMQIIGAESNDQMAQEAFRAMRDDYEAKMGDIAAMTRDAAEVVTRFDMGRAVAIEDLDAKLAQLTQRADHLMLSAPGTIQGMNQPMPAVVASTSTQSAGSYLNLGGEKK